MKASEYMALAEKPVKKGRYFRADAEKRTLGGIVFETKAEMIRWAELQHLEKAGDISELRRQIPYALEINGWHVGKYTPDFEYITKEGRKVIEDVKSKATEKATDARLRIKVFEALYGIEVNIIGAAKRSRKLKRVTK